MITMLGGHPHAVSLAAPLLQDRSLTELYRLLNSQERKAGVRKLTGLINNSMSSLTVSLEASLNAVRKRDKLAYNFFLFVGLCPGGIKQNEID